MSNSTTEPVAGHMEIIAGATFRELWPRATVPYRVQEINEVLCKMDGTPVPDSDITLEDYTDCTAVMELRDAESNTLLATLSTADSTILLTSSSPENFPTRKDALSFFMSPADTKALPPFAAAIGHVEVRRPWGDVERQYEFTFSYRPEKTITDPAISP